MRAQSGRTLVVSLSGNDSNPGTEAQPLRTIQRAADLSLPGDTILIRAGEYTHYPNSGANVDIRRSGTPTEWITFRAYPGERPVIISPTWNAFRISGASYIEINGFEVRGITSSISSNSGNGIVAFDGAHHIRILNNTVYGVPGGGIGGVRADYLHIEGNTIYDTGHGSEFGNSAISLYKLANFDTGAGYHNIVRGNIIYFNRQTRPTVGVGQITDGNCVIIDDSRQQQGGTLPPYTGSTLIENNVCFNNGGRGIHVFRSDNVDVFHNTLYQNAQTDALDDGGSELSVVYAGNVRFRANIVFARAGKRANNVFSSTNVSFADNLYFGTTNIPTRGIGDLTGLDPLFVAPSLNAATADFRLQAGSPALDRITANFTTPRDLLGTARPQGTGSDLGAYERTPTAGASLTVALTLQGRALNTPAMAIPVSVELRSGSTVVGSYTTTIGTNGQFTLNNLPLGTFALRVRPQRYLSATQPVTLMSGVTSLNFSALRGGDINDDNLVSLADFSLLSTSFNLVAGNPGYNANADINGDSAVTLVDFGILASNFNLAGG
jgi:parallel beta-helix repeat protein